MLSRYERQAAYVAGRPGRLLDNRHRRGDFLAVMERRGWDALGIEPSTATEDRRRGWMILDEHFPEDCSLPDEPST